MRFIVYNLKGERIQDLFGIAEHKLIAGGLDAITIRTAQNFVQKNYRVLYMDPKTGKWYEFIAASPEDSHGPEGITYTIYAENSLIGITGWIEDKRAYGDEETPGVSADFALSIALAGTGWSGEAENFDPQKINFYHVTPYEAIKKIIDTFKAEIETEIVVEGRSITRRLHLRHKVGRFWGKRFSFAKDMTNIKRTISPDDIITRLYGYGKGEEKEGGGYGRRISFEGINGGKPYLDNEEATQKYCYKGIPFVGSAIFEDIEDPAALKKATQKELDIVSRPKVTYEASVTDLASYGMDFEGVQVGDTCNGRDKDLDVAFTARITEMTVDPDGIKPTQIVLGEYLDILSRSSSEMEKDLASLKTRSTLWDNIAHGKFTTKFIDSVIGGVNEQFVVNGSYIRMDPKRGIFITDKATEKESTWAMQLSSAGFRIADGKTGENWNWRTFGTGKGFIADLIVAGIIKGFLMQINLDAGVFKTWEMDGELGTKIEIGKGAINFYFNNEKFGAIRTTQKWEYNAPPDRYLILPKDRPSLTLSPGQRDFLTFTADFGGRVVATAAFGAYQGEAIAVLPESICFGLWDSRYRFRFKSSYINGAPVRMIVSEGENGEVGAIAFSDDDFMYRRRDKSWVYLNDKFSAVEQDIDNFNNTISKLQSQSETNKSNIDTLWGLFNTVNALTNSLRAHQNQINNLSADISDLKRRVANLEG